MKFISLFTGIGGFDLGFEQAGMKPVFQVENDKNCQWLLNKKWPDVPKAKDIRDVRSNLPTADLICGGFPCQDVSVAGRRAGLAGGRSGLWFEFSRIIAEVKPQWVVIENVPGLLSSNGGRDMGAIVGALAELGYWWAYRVLNAQYWGVPQRRRRVFIVGCLTKGRAQEVLFERESSPWDTPPGRETGAELARDVAATIRSGGKGGRPSVRADGYGLVAFGGGNTKGAISRASRCAANGQRLDFESETFVCSFSAGNSGDSYGVAYSKSVANTFNGYTGGPDDNDAQANHIVLNRRNFNDTGAIIGVRRLTPIECERLQGFPDNWTKVQSDSIRYRQLGNAVAVPVAKWIGQRIVRLSRETA